MKPWKIAIMLSYISIASMSAAIITPALPDIQNTLHINQGQIGWIVSIFLIGYTIGQFIYSPIANRYGRLKALRAGLIINLIGIVICMIGASSNNYTTLLLGRLITALGASAGLSCTFMLINESLSHDKAKHALSFSAVSFTLGIGLAVVIGGIVTHYLRWEDCFWFLLAQGIIMLLLTQLFRETLKQPIKISMFAMLHTYGKALCHKTLFIFSACVGLVSVFSYCFSEAAPFITHDLFKLSAESYGYWNILNMAGMLAGALVCSSIIKKYSNLKILIPAILAMIIALLLMTILSLIGVLNIVTFFILTTSAYFFSSWIFPVAAHVASNAIADKSNASGAMNFINMGSAVLSVTILGYLPISQLWGFIIIVLGFAGLCLLGVFIQKS